MLEATYAHYLSTIHAHTFVIRTTFILMGLFNIVGKLITGNILDHSIKAPVIFSLVGNVLMIVPYFTLATMPIWHIEGHYQQWVIMGGSPMLTCGFVFVFLSAFFRMYHINFDSLSAKETSTLISGDEIEVVKED